MQECNKTDSEGRVHGIWEDYYQDGQLSHRCTYYHGLMHGISESYWSNGSLVYRGRWNMGEKIGYWEYGHNKPRYHARM